LHKYALLYFVSRVAPLIFEVSVYYSSYVSSQKVCKNSCVIRITIVTGVRQQAENGKAQCSSLAAVYVVKLTDSRGRLPDYKIARMRDQSNGQKWQHGVCHSVWEK
jgi:hypothetical protein